MGATEKRAVVESKVSHRGTVPVRDRGAILNLKDFITSWRGERRQSLDRISRVLEYAGRPHEAVPAFHVTGTNGKGSVSCAIASLLGALGLRTVLTTSPHLRELNERVVVNGVKLSDEALFDFGSRVLTISQRLNLRLSLHEIMTAIAFMFADESHADFLVLEVGLGGRNDSTNVVGSTTVGVITTIGLDHVERLGPTLSDIAREKAGIIKPSMRGIIVGSVEAAAREIITHEAKKYAIPAHFFGEDISVGVGPSGREHRYFGPWFEGNFETTLVGNHQVANMSLAIAAVGCMGLPVQRAISGLSTVVWPGRLEYVHNHQFARPVLLDGAHNPDGASVLATYLHKKYPGARFDFIFGALEGKDWQQMIDVLLPYSRTWGIVVPNSERAESRYNISDYLTRSGVSSEAIIRLHDAAEVFQFINREFSPELPLVAYGSLYLIGDLRSQLGVPDKPYWHFNSSSAVLPLGQLYE